MLLIAVVWMGLCAAGGRSWILEDIPIDTARVEAADEKIDPNTASFASLCRLSQIGPAKAQAIVEYRSARHGTVFRSLEDLGGVSGIGPATIRRNARHLRVNTQVPKHQ